MRTLSKFIAAIYLLSFVSATSAAELTVRLVNGDGKPLVDAVLFATTPAAPPRASTGKSSKIVQRALVFDPFVTVVEKGTAINFPNEDPMLHHVYSFSPPKRFELKLYKGSPPSPVVFDAPGVVAIGCNVHDWMVAYIMVVDSPFFAKTDRNGEARLVKLPSGKFNLMAWYPGMQKPALAESVELRNDESKRIERQLEVPLRSRPRAPPYDPIKY